MIVVFGLVIRLAPVLEELHILGVVFDGLVEISEGLFVVLLLVVAASKAIKDARDRWVFTLSCLEVPDCGIDLSVSELGRAVVEVSFDTLFVKLDCPFKVLYRLLIVAFVLVNKTTLDVDRLVIR